MKATSEENVWQINARHILSLKVHSAGYNVVADNTRLSSFRLAVAGFHRFERQQQLLPLKSVKSIEILRKFELIAVQGHPRSSILAPIESAYTISY